MHEYEFSKPSLTSGCGKNLPGKLHELRVLALNQPKCFPKDLHGSQIHQIRRLPMFAPKERTGSWASTTTRRSPTSSFLNPRRLFKNLKQGRNGRYEQKLKPPYALLNGSELGLDTRAQSKDLDRGAICVCFTALKSCIVVGSATSSTRFVLHCYRICQ